MKVTVPNKGCTPLACLRKFIVQNDLIDLPPHRLHRHYGGAGPQQVVVVQRELVLIAEVLNKFAICGFRTSRELLPIVGPLRFPRAADNIKPVATETCRRSCRSACRCTFAA